MMTMRKEEMNIQTYKVIAREYILTVSRVGKDAFVTAAATAAAHLFIKFDELL